MVQRAPTRTTGSDRTQPGYGPHTSANVFGKSNERNPMTFITTHPVFALIALVLFVLLIVLFVGGLLHSAGMHDEPVPPSSFIEPQDFSGIDTCTSVSVELASLGFEVKSWGTEFQITDHDGLTFYMPKTATLEQCLLRYAEKQKQFRAA
jgi:hypothetical protein